MDKFKRNCWNMAFMIGPKFQNRGLGKPGMKELVHYIKDKHKCDKIVLGHRSENERAASLFTSLGFKEIDRNDREIIRQLMFSPHSFYTMRNRLLLEVGFS
ncbi:GNAT family N-acetyltransferase [Paenibacillus tarimensis]